MSSDVREYDVCLSFAGEDRHYVGRVAACLRDAGVRVFYDEYERANLWGKDLFQHLDAIYRRQARFCVIFVSAAYAAKTWTRHELKSAQARALGQRDEYILPVRLDRTELPAVLETTGYIDGGITTADEVAELIIRKIDNRVEPLANDTVKPPSTVRSRNFLEVFSAARIFQFFLAAFVVSMSYGVAGALLLYYVDSSRAAQQFLTLYLGPFNTLLCLGVVTGVTLFVLNYQTVVFHSVESAFDEGGLLSSGYFVAKARFLSLRRTVVFVAEVIAIVFLIFSFCGFPLSGAAENLMMIAICAQWAMVAYIARKVAYACAMLNALLPLSVDGSLFTSRELSHINTYVRMACTLVVAFLYMYVAAYHDAPFLYDSFIGVAAQRFLVYPAAVAAAGFVVLNFYPRVVLRALYDKSIDAAVRGEGAPPAHLGVAIETNLRSEFRYNLQFSLSDLLVVGGVSLIMLRLAA